jgi:hypothetical protein
MGMQMQDNQIVADDDEAGADKDVVARGMEMQDNEIVVDDDVQAS